MSSSLSATPAMGNVDLILRGGDLRDYGVIEVLATMHAQQLTGVLRVRSGSDRYSLYTMEGDVIAAESDAESQRLSTRLVRKGLLTSEQVEAATKKASDTHPLGEVLVTEGMISEDALSTLLGEQFQDTLFSSFLVHEGRYEVEALDAIFAENIQLLFDTPELLDEGRKLRDDLSHLVAALADGERGLAKGSAASKVLLTSEQKAVLELAQKHQTLDATLSNSHADRIPTLKTVVQLLERHVLAIAKIGDGGAQTGPGRRSQLRRDPKAGLFSSSDSVLDKVDLSHVVHFTVATDIPLTGVVETVGIEDVEDREAELESQQTVFMERADLAEAQAGPSPRPGDQLTNIEDADDASGELVFTEDGEVAEAEAFEKTEASVIRRARSQHIGRSLSPIGLTPSQKQTLRRRVQVYNRMYQTLYAHACQHARRQEVLTRFQGYFANNGETYGPLFFGLEFRTDGSLNPEIVLENLQKSPFEKPFEVFDLALHDVTRYLLRDTGSLISDAAAETRLREAVLDIQKQLFRKGANVPPLG